MRFIDYFQSGQTNLRRSKLRTFLTIFAIVIGTFTLAMTTAFGQGLQQIVNNQLQAYTSPNVISVAVASNKQIPAGTVPAYQEGRQSTGGNRDSQQFTMSQHDIDSIKTVPNVIAAYPQYQSIKPSFIQYQNQKFLISIDALYPGQQPQLAAGSLPSTGSNGLVLSYPYIKTIGVNAASDLVGKQVNIHLVNNTSPAQQEDITYTVSAVLADTIHSPNSFLPEDEAAKLVRFQQGSNPEFTMVTAITNGALTPQQDNALKSALASKGYSGQSYEDIKTNFQKPLKIVQYGLDGFAGVALLAAAIGIINTLLMAVLERTQEVGLMKALGMRRKGIFGLFIMEALVIGLWGGVIGVALGWLLGSIANVVLSKSIFKGLGSQHILSYPFKYMLIIVVGAMILGVIAGALPALRASRLDPIDALRRE